MRRAATGRQDRRSPRGLPSRFPRSAGGHDAARARRGAHREHRHHRLHAVRPPGAVPGSCGGAASAGDVLALDVPRTARALALAASFSSGIKANFGAMTKPLHIGHVARNGLLAALLAERGFESNPAALEHKQGWLAVFNGEGNYWPERMFADWGAPWEIETSDMGLKQFPCCGSTHPAIAMMLKLV